MSGRLARICVCEQFGASLSAKRHIGARAPGKNWFPRFCFYGPEKTVEDETWKMPDIEKVN